MVRALKRGRSRRRRVPRIEAHQRRRRIRLGHDGASSSDCCFRRALTPAAATRALVAKPIVVTGGHGGQRPRQAKRVVGAVTVAVAQQEQVLVIAPSARVADGGSHIRRGAEIERRAA